MKKARMNISHSRFILFKLKIFGEIVTTKSERDYLAFSCRRLWLRGRPLQICQLN